MRVILEHQENGQYLAVPMVGESTLQRIEAVLAEVQKATGYPWKMCSQPKKIVYVENNHSGIINFVI